MRQQSQSILTIAQRELMETIRSRWVVLSGTLFGVLALALLLFGMRSVGAYGFGGFSRTTIGLLNAVVIALVLGGCATSTAGPIRQGDIAPAVAVTKLTGEQIKLRPRPGEMLWLSFWASWCHPCQAEWPDLNQAQQHLAGKGLQLVAVSVNEQSDQVQAFLATHLAAFTVALDPHGELAARYAVVGFPPHVLIDKAGIVRAIVRGPIDEQHARKLLELTDSSETN